MCFCDVRLSLILFVFFTGRGGSAGAKFRISLGLPVGAVINCADNTGKFYGMTFCNRLYMRVF